MKLLLSAVVLALAVSCTFAAGYYAPRKSSTGGLYQQIMSHIIGGYKPAARQTQGGYYPRSYSKGYGSSSDDSSGSHESGYGGGYQAVVQQPDGQQRGYGAAAARFAGYKAAASYRSKSYGRKSYGRRSYGRRSYRPKSYGRKPSRRSYKGGYRPKGYRPKRRPSY